MAGIYIHIPFCKQACHYCDFHFSTNQSYKSLMIESIVRELELQKKSLGESRIQSIYLGGGTPSLLSIKEIESIINTIFKNYSLDTSPEITLEANPDDLSKEYLLHLYRAGINRLSIGIQSFHDDFLKFMNRAHNAQEAERATYLAKEAGFEHLTTDLIYGIPYKDHSVFEKDLEKIVALDTCHISAYCLTIEEKTVFGKWEKDGKLKVPEEEFAAEQLEILMDFLPSHNFEQYEISNFARNEKYSVHNTNYWRGIPYLGIGPGAHSFNITHRQSNIANNLLYIKSIKEGRIPAITEKLSEKDRFNELLLTGLRTKWGIDISKLSQAFPSFYKNIKPGIDNLIIHGLLSHTEDKITLTPSGKLLADEITSQLLVV